MSEHVHMITPRNFPKTYKAILKMSEPRAVAEVDLDALRVQVEGLNLEENILGSGAYGVVYKVTVDGKKCIAKKLHNILIHAVRYYPRGQDDTIIRKFHNECRIMSQLKHPKWLALWESTMVVTGTTSV